MKIMWPCSSKSIYCWTTSKRTSDENHEIEFTKTKNYTYKKNFKFCQKYGQCKEWKVWVFSQGNWKEVTL